MVISKTLKAFTQREKACSVSGFALLLEEEPCPLCLQMVFSITHPGPLFFITKF